MSLHEAIKGGYEELAASLVEDGASLSDKDAQGDTPLHAAAEEGSVRITLLLLQAGADKDARGKHHRTPLHHAAFKRHAPVVRVLLEAVADPTLLDQIGQTPLSYVSGGSFRTGEQEAQAREVVKTMIELGVALNLHQAIKFGGTEERAIEFGVNKDLAVSLVESAASVNDADLSGDTPLHVASSEGSVGITLMLLQKRADIDSRNMCLQTPLHFAARKLHAPVVQALLEAGANPTLRDMTGKTPLSAALFEGAPADRIPEVVETMIELGADVNFVGEGHGMSFPPFHSVGTPLHAAVSRGLDDCIEILVTAGAKIDALDERGQTPLLIAAENGNVGPTLLLLNKGADMNVKGRSRLTPLLRAARRTHIPVVRALIQAGADATLQANPLPLALLMGTPVDRMAEVVETMIELGVDVNGHDENGTTPLHAAVFRGLEQPFPQQEACIDMLIAAGANIEARCPQGRTPLNVGAAQIRVVRSLVDHGAEVNTQDNEGSTPLHRAIGDRFMNVDFAETVDALLRAGADEAVLDGQGRTPAEREVYNTCDVPDWKEKQSRARGLLAAAPADRRWRRRALLVMCIARHRREEAQLPDDTAGSGSGEGWGGVAARVLHMGLDMGVLRAIVGFL